MHGTKSPLPAGITLEKIEAIFAGDDFELQRKIHLLITHPYYTFRPRPDCPEDYDEQTSFVNSNAKFSICLGGNGSGKSAAAALKTARYLLGTMPMREGIPFWVIGASYELACAVCWVEKLSTFIPPELIKHISWRDSKRHWPAAVVLRHPLHPDRDGWTIEFKSYEQGRELFQARSIGGYWFNEAVPMSIVEEVQARCRDYGSPGWADFTPIDMPTTEWENRYHKPPPGWRFFHLNSLKNETLPEGFMRDYLESIPEDMRETRQIGAFSTRRGQVFKEWRPNHHVIEPFRIPHDWHRTRGIDFGYNNPFCCLWIARNYDGVYYVYDEHYESQQTHDYHAAKIKERYWNLDDPHIGQTYSDHDPQERAELSLRGIHTALANKNIHRGIDVMRRLMMINKATGKSRLYVFTTCKKLIEEIPAYRWADPTGREGSGKQKNPNEVPVDFFNHGIDSLRYALATEEMNMTNGAPEGVWRTREQTNQSYPIPARLWAYGSAVSQRSSSGGNGGSGGNRNSVQARKGGKYGNHPV